MFKRFHLFEFGDLIWFPHIFRRFTTDFLEFGANKFDVYKPIIPIVKKGIGYTKDHKILDIASGSGGGLLKLAEHLKTEYPTLKIQLSDYYPNKVSLARTKQKGSGIFDYIEFSIDARDVPSYMEGFRTMFLSFHHFKPMDAKLILQNAIDANQPIGIFEAQQRNIKSLIPMLLSPISLLLLTPFIRPFSLLRVLFTYLVPILPLVVLWDGVVSVLRTYNEDELNQMILELKSSSNYHWDVDLKKGKANDILYLVGLPKSP